MANMANGRLHAPFFFVLRKFNLMSIEHVRELLACARQRTLKFPVLNYWK